MPIAPARIAAFDVLLRVETQDAYAVELLHSEGISRLSPVDRNLATQLVMGVLRWRSRLDSMISRFVSGRNEISKLDHEVRIALRLAIFQSKFLERVPDSAAVNDSVELVKRARKNSAAPLVNAVLRKLLKSTDSPSPPMLDSAEAVANELAHPQWLVDSWTEQFGLSKSLRVCEYDQSTPETSIRLREINASDCIEQLASEGVTLDPGSLMANARRVFLGDITRTSPLYDGRIAIQDEGSQLVAALLGKGRRILDCCAAPGGKTAAIAVKNPSATILATELHPQRARVMRKLNCPPNVNVVVADATRLPMSGKFDRILVYVPCSGTGTLSRNPEIKWKLRPSDLEDLHGRQVAILKAALDCLTENGRAVYSTCSLERLENETVIEEVLRHRPGIALVECRDTLQQLRDDGELIWPHLGDLIDGPFLRTIPGIVPCDGFFAALIEKK